MKVAQINNTDYRYKTSFKGIIRTVWRKTPSPNGVHLIDTIKHKNNSWMFRPNVRECIRQYNAFSKLFPGTEKVNVYDCACSLGYGVYGFLLWLLSGHEKHPERFFPIIAKDYDEDIIKAAREGLLPLNEDEIWNICDVVRKDDVIKKEDLDEFFHVDYNNSENMLIGTKCYGYMAKPTKILTDKVQFSVADIREDYVNIEPHRSLVWATNFWPYMEKEDRYKLAQNLYNQFAKGSAIKISDDFDNNRICLQDSKSTAELLLDTGFHPADGIKNIFVK